MTRGRGCDERSHRPRTGEMPEEPSEHEKEQQWRSDLHSFRKAIWSHWWKWIGVAVGGTAISGWQMMGGAIPYWFGPLVLCIGLVIAAFQAFREQAKIAREASSRAVEAEEQIKKLINPILLIGCGDAVEGANTRNRQIGTRPPSGVEVFRETEPLFGDFLGFVITNPGAVVAEKCRCDLTRLERGQQTIWSQASALPFYPREAKEELMTEKDIRPGIPMPVSLCTITDDGWVLFGSLGRPWRFRDSFENMFQTHGKYIFRVTVSSEKTPPVFAAFELEWTGEKSTSDFRKLPATQAAT